MADIQRLLDALQRLAEAGNSVVVIEHHLDVIKTADWVIDLGPEGGKHGGTVVVAQGTPEQVARCEDSYTGQFFEGRASPQHVIFVRVPLNELDIPKTHLTFTLRLL